MENYFVEQFSGVSEILNRFQNFETQSLYLLPLSRVRRVVNSLAESLALVETEKGSLASEIPSFKSFFDLMFAQDTNLRFNASQSEGVFFLFNSEDLSNSLETLRKARFEYELARNSSEIAVPDSVSEHYSRSLAATSHFLIYEALAIVIDSSRAKWAPKMTKNSLDCSSFEWPGSIVHPELTVHDAIVFSDVSEISDLSSFIHSSEYSYAKVLSTMKNQFLSTSVWVPIILTSRINYSRSWKAWMPADLVRKIAHPQFGHQEIKFSAQVGWQVLSYRRLLDNSLQLRCVTVADYLSLSSNEREALRDHLFKYPSDQRSRLSLDSEAQNGLLRDIKQLTYLSKLQFASSTPRSSNWLQVIKD